MAPPHTDFPNGNIMNDMINGMKDVSTAASAGWYNMMCPCRHHIPSYFEFVGGVYAI